MRHRRSQRLAAGFTLIDALVTMAILGVLTTLAVVSYDRYLRRAGRVDATTALLRMASAQEKFYAQNGGYTDDLESAPPDGLGIEGTERGLYTLSIDLDPGGAAIGYTAIATADADDSQAGDRDCQVFTIDERSLRGAADADGATGQEITDRCWR
ncbi:MAG: hypothetical protein FJ197_07210 [Gammaproteobacteria bacterium]|nr:hypothetical protein [Gammaproteobacteria bacterium]